MKQEDYEEYEENVMRAIMEFNTLFGDYVKQMNPELWGRALDYAKSFAKSGNVSFDYTAEKTQEHITNTLLSQTIFIKELVEDIEDMVNEYSEFVENNKDLSTQEIMQKWMEQAMSTPDDPFHYEKELDMFIKCDHKFTFEQFDDEDWLNYTNICIRCVKNKVFQNKYIAIMEQYLGKCELYSHYIQCITDQNNP